MRAGCITCAAGQRCTRWPDCARQPCLSVSRGFALTQGPLSRRSRQGISGAVRAYLELHDRPVGTAQQEEEAALAGMSPEEQKR
jgi:hypothetical protein